MENIYRKYSFQENGTKGWKKNVPYKNFNAIYTNYINIKIIIQMLYILYIQILNAKLITLKFQVGLI